MCVRLVECSLLLSARKGEADAKRTNSSWYTEEFPRMITGWRESFQTPGLPFVYVELCTEYGAEEPKEKDFYNAQRSALTLPASGFATTTDIQRALHPPNKQAVADRLIRCVNSCRCLPCPIKCFSISS